MQVRNGRSIVVGSLSQPWAEGLDSRFGTILLAGKIENCVFLRSIHGHISRVSYPGLLHGRFERSDGTNASNQYHGIGKLDEAIPCWLAWINLTVWKLFSAKRKKHRLHVKVSSPTVSSTLNGQQNPRVQLEDDFWISESTEIWQACPSLGKTITQSNYSQLARTGHVGYDIAHHQSPILAPRIFLRWSYAFRLTEVTTRAPEGFLNIATAKRRCRL